MITEETKYNVKNRSSSIVVYSIPESNLRREFAPGETKPIPYGELEKLTYQSGGRELIENFLQILDEEVTSDLNVNREIEYDMSEDDVKKLLLSDPLDNFLDALDYAPIGVIDLIKTLAVALPLTDIEKRRALKEKTGFDVDAALKHVEEEKVEETAKTNTTAPTGRRVQPAAAETTTTGRRTTPKYKKVETKTAETETKTE